MPTLARTQAHIRATVNRYLTETCTLIREDTGSGAAGQETIVRTTVGEDVPCRIISGGQSNTSASDLMAAREMLTDLYTLIVGQGVTLDVNYLVIVNDITYSIVRLETAWTDEPFRKAIVTRKR